MMYKLNSLIATLAIFTAPVFSFAGEKMQEIDLPAGFVVEAGTTKDVALAQARRIRTLVIEAQGQSTNSMVEVIINGKVKGTIFAPGTDPRYVVTIEDVASAITFKHLAGGGMQVLRIQATTSQWTAPDWSLATPYETGSLVKELAAVSIEVIENLRLKIDPSDDAKYLLPIKLAAGKVFIMTNGHGPVSKVATAELEKLAIEINNSRVYLDRIMSNPELFEDAVTMLTVFESIQDLLN